MQKLISKVKSWLTIPRHRRQLIIGAVGVFVLIGVVAFSPQISNLLSLFGSKAATGVSWNSTTPVVGSDFRDAQVVDAYDANGQHWMYVIGGIGEDNLRKNTVKRIAIDEVGDIIPGSIWEDALDGIPQMNFGHAGGKSFVYKNYIYMVAGDIHEAGNGSIEDPLAYSTIERFNPNFSTGWEVYMLMTGVNFIPEILVTKSGELHVVGGIYGNMPNMGGIDRTSDYQAWDDLNLSTRKVIGATQIPLWYGWNTEATIALSRSIVGSSVLTSSAYGRFYTTVSQHYILDLNNRNATPYEGELGSDGGGNIPTLIGSSPATGEFMVGGDFLRGSFTNINGYVVAHPLPQGRAGHKIFEQDGDIYVVGGASWFNEQYSSSYNPYNNINTTSRFYPFWVITDTNYPKPQNQWVGGPNTNFMGNIAYRWNGSSWNGTGSNILDQKYSTTVIEDIGSEERIKSGIAFMGVEKYADKNGINKSLAIGGIRNKANQFTTTDYTYGTSRTIQTFMTTDAIDNTFVLDSLDGWQNVEPYPNKHFYISTVGLGNSAIGFGGHTASNNYQFSILAQEIVREGRPIQNVTSVSTYRWSWIEQDDGSGNGIWRWISQSGIPYSSVQFSGTGIFVNESLNKTNVYRVGGDNQINGLSTIVETTGPLDFINLIDPDINQSNFKLIPVDNDAISRIGGDNNDIAAVMFQLNDSNGSPLSDIFVGINSDNDNLVEKCMPNKSISEVWGWVCLFGSWRDGSATLWPNNKTDENGVATVFIRSKDILTENQHPNGLTVNNISGFWIVPGSGNTSDNPTGEYSFGDLQLSRVKAPFEPNSQVHFLNQNGSSDSSSTKQVLADGSDYAEIEVLIKDGNPLFPRSANFYDEFIGLASTHPITVIQTRPFNQNAASDGEAKFIVKSSVPGEAKIYARYKPVNFYQGVNWWVDYVPWVYLTDHILTINFTGDAGTLTPDNAKQGDQNVAIEATGNATRWAQGTTTVDFVNPPEITLDRTGNLSLDNLTIDTQYTDFEVSVSNYSNQTVELSVVEGDGSLTQSSVETDGSGNANFTYRTGTSDGIEKIQASIANGQITKEMWLTVGESTPLYSLEYRLSGDITSSNPYTVVRARLLNSLGKPVTGISPSFEFTNNDNGILFETNYNGETGIASVLYKASSDGFDGEIFIDASFNNAISVFDRIPIDNKFGGGGAGINTSNLNIVDDENLTFNANIGDTTKIGNWILRVTTNIGGQNETYDYGFEVTSKIVANEGIISAISPSTSHRGVDNLVVDITGIGTTFDAVDPSDIDVTFMSDLGDSGDIEVTDVDSLSSTNLSVTLNIDDYATVGYWDIEVDLGAGIKYIMPGNLDFLVSPDDISGYYIDLDVGKYGTNWEPGTLPANGVATLDLIASAKKFDVWENINTPVSATFTSSLTPQNGTLTPPTSSGTFVYKADEAKGEVEVLFETTITDASLPEGTLDLEVSATLTKLANQVTLDITVPLQGNRYNYQTSEEIRVVVVRENSTTPIIDEKFKIDENDKILGLPIIYVSTGLKYNIWVDPPNHLSVGASFTATSEVESTITPTLTSKEGEEFSFIGDINVGTHNNQVNAFDWQMFASQFLEDLVSPIADFSGDGDVNAMDWPYMLGSWMKEGAVKLF